MWTEIFSFALAFLIIAGLFLALVYGPWWAKLLAVIAIALTLSLVYVFLCMSSRISRAAERRERRP